MPGEDGKWLAQEVSKKFPNIPIIFHTSRPLDELKKISPQVKDVIDKEVSLPSTILDAAKKVLGASSGVVGEEKVDFNTLNDKTPAGEEEGNSAQNLDKALAGSVLPRGRNKDLINFLNPLVVRLMNIDPLAVDKTSSQWQEILSLMEDFESKKFHFTGYHLAMSPVPGYHAIFQALNPEKIYQLKLVWEEDFGMRLCFYTEGDAFKFDLMGYKEQVKSNEKQRSFQAVSHKDSLEKVLKDHRERMKFVLNLMLGIDDPRTMDEQKLARIKKAIEVFNHKQYEAEAVGKRSGGNHWAIMATPREGFNLTFNDLIEPKYGLWMEWENGIGLRIYAIGLNDVVKYNPMTYRDQIQDKVPLRSADYVTRGRSFEEVYRRPNDILKALVNAYAEIKAKHLSSSSPEWDWLDAMIIQANLHGYLIEPESIDNKGYRVYMFNLRRNLNMVFGALTEERYGLTFDLDQSNDNPFQMVLAYQDIRHPFVVPEDYMGVDKNYGESKAFSALRVFYKPRSNDPKRELALRALINRVIQLGYISKEENVQIKSMAESIRDQAFLYTPKSSGAYTVPLITYQYVFQGLKPLTPYKIFPYKEKDIGLVIYFVSKKGTRAYLVSPIHDFSKKGKRYNGRIVMRARTFKEARSLLRNLGALKRAKSEAPQTSYLPEQDTSAFEIRAVLSKAGFTPEQMTKLLMIGEEVYKQDGLSLEEILVRVGVKDDQAEFYKKAWRETLPKILQPYYQDFSLDNDPGSSGIVSSPAGEGNDATNNAASGIIYFDRMKIEELREDSLVMALSDDEITRLEKQFPQYNWRKAAQVIWPELVRYKGDRIHTQEQRIYFGNQVWARRHFIFLIRDLLSHTLTDAAFINKMTVAHNDLLSKTGNYDPSNGHVKDFVKFFGDPDADLLSELKKDLDGVFDSENLTDQAFEKYLFQAISESLYIFGRRNYSFHMNLFNAILRLHGLIGIDQGRYDFNYMLSKFKYPPLQKELSLHIQSANPGLKLKDFYKTFVSARPLLSDKPAENVVQEAMGANNDKKISSPSGAAPIVFAYNMTLEDAERWSSDLNNDFWEVPQELIYMTPPVVKPVFGKLLKEKIGKQLSPDIDKTLEGITTELITNSGFAEAEFLIHVVPGPSNEKKYIFEMTFHPFQKVLKDDRSHWKMIEANYALFEKMGPEGLLKESRKKGVHYINFGDGLDTLGRFMKEKGKELSLVLRYETGGQSIHPRLWVDLTPFLAVSSPAGDSSAAKSRSREKLNNYILSRKEPAEWGFARRIVDKYNPKNICVLGPAVHVELGFAVINSSEDSTVTFVEPDSYWTRDAVNDVLEMISEEGNEDFLGRIKIIPKYVQDAIESDLKNKTFDFVYVPNVFNDPSVNGKNFIAESAVRLLGNKGYLVVENNRTGPNDNAYNLIVEAAKKWNINLVQDKDDPWSWQRVDLSVGQDLKGGIDFNRENINLQTKGDDIEFSIPPEFEGIGLNSIEGFVPVIISVTPIADIFPLLGLNKEGMEQPPVMEKVKDAREPEKLSLVQ